MTSIGWMEVSGDAPALAPLGWEILTYSIERASQWLADLPRPGCL